MGYTISCTLCADSGILAEYQGEKGKCLYVRGSQHIYELESGVKTNCLFMHNQALSNGSKDLHFKMTAKNPQILKYRSQNKDQQTVNMNSGSEWRGDPSLGQCLCLIGMVED